MLRNELVDCRKAISPYVRHTPVQTSKSINEIVGGEVFFKCENFQRTGSFKIRGATNAVMHLTEDQKKAGVVAHSSGNFAQALALAASNLGVKSYIIMPKTAPQVKKDATVGYGATLIECEPTMASREQTAAKIAEQTGATFIHPSNNIEVIVGQSTATQELLSDFPDLDIIISPVGGGGLIAGTALAASTFGKECRVFGGEPAEADDAYRSMISGKIEKNITTNTIADGLISNLGDINFPIIREHVDRITRLTEKEIVAAMRLILERMKIIIEPSSAVAVAAMLKGKDELRSKKIGVILSGGNLDLESLPF